MSEQEEKVAEQAEVAALRLRNAELVKAVEAAEQQSAKIATELQYERDVRAAAERGEAKPRKPKTDDK